MNTNSPRSFAVNASQLGSRSTGDDELVSVPRTSFDQLQDFITTVAKKFDGHDARIHEVEQKLCRSGGASSDDFYTNPFSAIAEHEGIKALARGSTSTGRMAIEGGAKALLTVPAAPSYGRVVTPFQRPIRIFDFMPRVGNTTGVAQYVQVGGTNAAAIQVNAGDLKAEANLASELQTTQIPTIAVWQAIPRQHLADVPRLLQSVSQVFLHFLMEKAEQETIATLLADATPMVPTASNAADAWSEAETTLRARGATASVGIVHPNRLHLLRTMRGDDGQFLSGWFTPGDPPKAFNVPLLTSPAMAANEVLMFDSQAVELNDRE